MLLKKVIIPEFSVNGKLPEAGISIQDVVDAMEEYPSLLDRYPVGVYMAVMYDMKHLGIKTADVSARLKKTWKMRLDRDPELGERLRERIENATASRMKLYRDDPTKAKENYAASAATRKEKMQTDEDFRKQVMGNLAHGPDALYAKCRADKKFREKIFKARRASLAKGLRTIKRRAATRRNKLRRIIERELGSVYDTTLGDVVSYLQTEKPDFLALYYRSEATIKKDLHALRNE